MVLDCSETILMANQPIADVLGYRSEVNLIGKDFKALLADGDLLKLTGLEKPVEGIRGQKQEQRDEGQTIASGDEKEDHT